MPEQQQIRAAVEGYAESFTKQDRERFAALLAANVVQYEPVGGPANRGRAAVTAFFDGVFEVIDRVEFRVTDLVITGDEAAFTFHITAHKKDGGVVEDRGIDTFRVGDDGLITEIKGYHDDAHTQVAGG
ncbi:nuclear transport factor 2 family protein [Streptomyces sp. NPDC101165]|uniref:nuclear transport factor 2 family protein n=1 Tax=Streptomyces sp. NPDC101165 TaxID=3366119 RepID=UPI00380E4ADE